MDCPLLQTDCPLLQSPGKTDCPFLHHIHTNRLSPSTGPLLPPFYRALLQSGAPRRKNRLSPSRRAVPGKNRLSPSTLPKRHRPLCLPEPGASGGTSHHCLVPVRSSWPMGANNASSAEQGGWFPGGIFTNRVFGNRTPSFDRNPGRGRVLAFDRMSAEPAARYRTENAGCWSVDPRRRNLDKFR